MTDIQQRLKELENERDRLWAETRLIRERVNQQWATMIDRPLPGLAIARHLALPGLRAFWPMSGIEASGVACALPDSDYNLTNNNTVEFGYTGVAPWAEFGGTNEHLSLSDATGIDLLGTETYISSSQRGVTIGGWFYFDNTASANENCIAKWGAAGQRSYRLIRNSDGYAQAIVSTDGTNVTNCIDDEEITAEIWSFMAMRFDPSTELVVFLNDQKTTSTSSIPASIHNSTADLCIGADSAPGSYLDGKASLCWISVCALSDNLLAKLYAAGRVVFGV